jgi:cytochrome c550
MSKVLWTLVGLLALFSVALSACGSDQGQPTAEQAAQAPASSATPHVEEEHAGDETLVEGLALFRSAGCAACHGQEGEGGTGPAIAGHTAEQVQRQIRTPKGDVMPAFSEDQLSDAQLDLIIGWVESLGPATGAHGHDDEASDEHAEGAESQPGLPLAAHLRLALFAAKDGNAGDAEHHLQNLAQVLEDEHTKSQVENILASIQAGASLHDVEHEIEELLGEIGLEAGQLVGPKFHLQLVLDSLALDDPQTARRHVEHYVDLVDDADLAEEAVKLQAHLAEGDLHAVVNGVIALLRGEEPDHGD